MAMSDPHPLTQKIQHSIENPATDDEFDIDREFDTVLADYGFTTSDLGGTVRFDGADPIVASTIRLAGATAIPLMAKSAAMAYLWRTAVDPSRTCPLTCGCAPDGCARSTSSSGSWSSGFRPLRFRRPTRRSR